MMKMYLLLAFWAASAALLSLPVAGQQMSRDALDEIARKPNGLREAARLSGHYILIDISTDDHPRSFVSYVATTYNDLATMAKDSEAVIVGTAMDHSVRLSAGGTSIITEYHIRAEQDFKANFMPGDVVLVAIPGGKVDFPEGTSAEIRTPNFPRMNDGSRYVLFLGPKNSSYRTTGGSQGIFELPGDGSGVKPFKTGFDPSSIAARKGEKQQDFLADVKAAVR